MKTSDISVLEPQADYELIDSGDGEKLERFGAFTLSRPDPQALWPRRLSADQWKKADGTFTRSDAAGDWSLAKDMPDRWQVSFGGLKLWIKPTAFKHVGLFPEQEPNWQWMKERIEEKSKKQAVQARGGAGDIEILNLFGYTGGATLACAQAGAKVVHIDGSKSAVAWARDNAELSGLADKPVRWIVEDARLFVERELKRGRSYDAIVMDPPAFGHGPANELWKIEDDFLALIGDCKKLLKPEPLFFLINGYSAGYSALAYENNLLSLKEQFGGDIETGELAIRETQIKEKGNTPRLLPAGIFARWSAL